MKTLTVWNSEEVKITIVLNGNEDITINPKASVTIETDHSFNSDNFYVDEDTEGKWMAKYMGDNKTELALYIKQSHWNSTKSKCGAYEEV
jgi:transposase-like protein